MNGSGFRPFDVVIPFSFRKGEITGERRPQSLQTRHLSSVDETSRIYWVYNSGFIGFPQLWFDGLCGQPVNERLVSSQLFVKQEIDKRLTSFSSPSGEVFMPSGKSAQPTITDNLDGTVTVQYSPTEAGLHEMHIKYNGTHIPGQKRGSLQSLSCRR